MNKTIKTILIVVVSILIIFIIRACYLTYVYSNYVDLVNQDTEIMNGWTLVKNQYQRNIDIIKTTSNIINKNINHTNLQMQAVVFTADSLSNIKMDTKDSLSMHSYVTAQKKLLEHALLAINAEFETNPKLESDMLLKEIKIQLNGSDNRINSSLKSYNETVLSYDITIQKFPKSIFAKLFGFTNYPMISIPQEEK